MLVSLASPWTINVNHYDCSFLKKFWNNGGSMCLIGCLYLLNNRNGSSIQCYKINIVHQFGRNNTVAEKYIYINSFRQNLQNNIQVQEIVLQIRKSKYSLLKLHHHHLMIHIISTTNNSKKEKLKKEKKKCKKLQFINRSIFAINHSKELVIFFPSFPKHIISLKNIEKMKKKNYKQLWMANYKYSLSIQSYSFFFFFGWLGEELYFIFYFYFFVSVCK